MSKNIRVVPEGLSREQTWQEFIYWKKIEMDFDIDEFGEIADQLFNSLYPKLEKETEGAVTDPFIGQKHTTDDNESIITPKTPDEIRGENFEKIKKGVNSAYVDVLK